MPRKKRTKTAKAVAKTADKSVGESVDKIVEAAPVKPLLERWHDLARRRLLSYVEIYRSGRWTIYYESRETFAAHMVEVIKAEKTWATLAGVAPIGDDDLRSAA